MYSNSHDVINKFLKRDVRSIEFAVNTSAFKKLLNKLKGVGVTGATEDVANIIKTNKIGIDVFDNLLETASSKLTKIDNIIHVHEIPLNKFEHLLKTGDLGKLTKALGSEVVIDGSSQRAFRFLASDFPHKSLNDI